MGSSRMSQINPRQILEKGILVPSDYTEIQQVGIDVSVVEELVLKNGEAANVKCNESVNFPANVFALPISRSTFNRQKIRVCGCVFDPGYRGNIYLTIYNFSGKDFTIPANERIAQMVFFKADTASLYDGQYQDNKGEE